MAAESRIGRRSETDLRLPVRNGFAVGHSCPGPGLHAGAAVLPARERPMLLNSSSLS